ncbi:TonB-dependent receptor plug domain-containing protein [Agaribacter marinus]|uniref:TonB-dependent receptor n=1 Tax=Agaribacter marinus TaxID=1431249 RepID=A0AA37T1P7_9ALTE|nr:TonB-dependent receptor [Agaribacter marinus]GLR72104.1 TonB-dependent receptor [Agaribacter marinus]
MTKHKTAHLALLASLLFTAGSACCENLRTSNVDRYDSTYFMALEPQTLYDVLTLIPAANSVLIDMANTADNRGFGSDGDQILINNKRVSGKDNSIEKELNNTLAQDIEYVELIRGTRSDLDVQSRGLVINVILKKHVDASIRWTFGGITTKSLATKPFGSIIYNNGNDGLKYRIGYERYVNPTEFTITDEYWNLDNQQIFAATRKRKNWFTRDSVSAKLEYEYSTRTHLQLNTLFEKYRVDSSYLSESENVIENSFNTTDLVYDWSKENWEVSGDITYDIDNDNHLKLLFISNRSDADDKIWQLNVLEHGQTTIDYRLPRLFVANETVLRGNWKHISNSKHSVDSGIEVAINKLDENVQFEALSGDVYHSTEETNIEEQRYEIFISHNVAISEFLNVQSSLVYENSALKVATQFQLQTDELLTSNDASSRSFAYLKPRLNLRYDLDAQHQLRFNYQRTVSQLNLDDFVPQFNRDEARLEETNPDLKPEMRDEFSMSWQAQWQATKNSITLSPYYHKITDLITEIPLINYSGDGNVDEAKEYGLKLNGHLSLDMLGIEDTIVTASYTIKTSDVLDPFTNEHTKFNGFSNHDWRLKINQNELIQDLSFTLTLAKRSPYTAARYDYKQTLTSNMTVNGFIDYQINKQLKLRLQGDYLLNREYQYERERFNGLSSASAFLRDEQRRYHWESRFSITLSGQF